MKYCVRCGNGMPDEAHFCVRCGAKMPELRRNPQAQAAESIVADRAPFGMQIPRIPQMTAAKNVQTDKAWKWLPLLLAAAAVLAVLLVAVAILKSRPASIDLDRYFSVQATGVNGYGTVRTEVDSASLRYDIAKALAKKGMISKDSLKNATPETMTDVLNMGFLQDTAKIEQVYYGIDYTIDRSEGLSNGDQVVLRFIYNNDLMKNYGIRFKGNEKKVKVSGLSEAQTFDAFADLTVSVEGIEPYGYFNMNYNGQLPLRFDADRMQDLRNGDQITVTVSPAGAKTFDEAFISRYGMVPQEIQRTYTVDGLTGYVKDLSEVTEAAAEAMRADTADRLTAEYAGASQVTMNEITFVGMYLLSAKNGDNWEAQNIAIPVYRISGTVRNWTETEEPRAFEGYMACEYRDLVRESDGTVSEDLSRADCQYHQIEMPSGYDWPMGWASLEELENDLVTVRIADFTSEYQDC